MSFILKNCEKCLNPLEIAPEHEVGRPVKCYCCGHILGDRKPAQLKFSDNTREPAPKTLIEKFIDMANKCQVEISQPKVELKPMAEVLVDEDILIYTSVENCFVALVSGPHRDDDSGYEGYCVEVKDINGEYTPYQDYVLTDERESWEDFIGWLELPKVMVKS